MNYNINIKKADECTLSFHSRSMRLKITNFELKSVNVYIFDF